MKTARWLLLILAWLAAPVPAADPLPPDSVYRLAMPLVRQDGTAAGLDLARGSPVLISLFYASCPHACPLLINTVQRLEKTLPPESRHRLKILLVSIDPDSDTPEKLAELVQRHKVDPARWTFARASAGDVRKLAAVLGIRYRELPDGEFNHSTVVSLLDGSGRIVQQTAEMMTLEESFIATLRSQVAGPQAASK
ncbi:MAG TPA: SCO family protein [Nevskiaceae bacterium]|nr:SCO family protein [Nevskiaceae bacterium]